MLLQLEKALLPMLVAFGNFAVDKLEQFENAELPTLVTRGKFSAVTFVLQNAESNIRITLGKSKVASSLQL